MKRLEMEFSPITGEDAQRQFFLQIKNCCAANEHNSYVKRYRTKPHQNGHSGCFDEDCFVSFTITASGQHNSITPGATHLLWTRLPGLNPARSSQCPVRRIFGLMRPFQKSPDASIFKARMYGCGVISLDGSLVCTTYLSSWSTPQCRCRQSVTAHKPLLHITQFMCCDT